MINREEIAKSIRGYSVSLGLLGAGALAVLAVLVGYWPLPPWVKYVQALLILPIIGVLFLVWREHVRVVRTMTQADSAPPASATSRRELLERQDVLMKLVDSQRNKVVSRMAAGVVHEFNNSLQVVVASAAHLQAHPRLDAESRTICREIIDTCTDASHLSRQLLALGERVVMESHVLDATKELEMLDRNIRRLLPANIAVSSEYGDEQLLVQVDPVHLRHTLLRLCLMLGDTMPDGGSVHMGVRAKESSFVEFSVSSRDARLEDAPESGSSSLLGGRGLPAEKEVGDLAVQAFAEQHQGHLSVSSSPEGGTRLGLALPRIVAGEVVADDTAQISLENRLFLVVDDDWRARQAISRTITDARGDVVVASSVEEALERLVHVERSVDVVCADAIMPGQPTRLLLDTLRESFPATKVLVCSAYSEGELVRRGIEIERFAHLGKPFFPNQLVHTIQELLRSTPHYEAN